MSKKIFKYQLETTDVQQVEMPIGAEILCIQTQNESPCIWALVNPANQTIKRTFEIFGTGHNVPENGNRKYIGTYQLNDGSLVFHCFELFANQPLLIASASNCAVMEEETFLSINGASRQDIGDSAFHKNKGNNSDKIWSKMVNAQAEKDRKLIIKREELRKEYWQKVENGELRPPTRNEKLISTANGNPDDECVIAARRLLEKKGIDWRQS